MYNNNTISKGIVKHPRLRYTQNIVFMNPLVNIQNKA